MSELKYGYNFSELCDRLQIVTLKVINSSTKNEAFEQEITDILHDIQIHLDNKPVNAEMIRGIVILTLINRFIFDNETFVRDSDDNGDVDDTTLLSKLKDSHKANSLRAAAKKHIQVQRGERVDSKLNYGKETGFWGIKF